MSKNKIKNILLIIILVSIAIGLVLFTNIKVDSSNGTFTLAEIMATGQGATPTANYSTIMRRSVEQLLGYTVSEETSSTNRNMEAQSEYGFCVGEHNANGNTNWYITKVLDIKSSGEASYKDIEERSYTSSDSIYAKLSIYAYMQNTYKIEDYGNRRGAATGYANSLDYLLPQAQYFTEISKITNSSAYPGISQDLINFENSYADFLSKLKAAGNSILEDDKTAEIQNTSNGTTYGQ